LSIVFLICLTGMADSDRIRGMKETKNPFDGAIASIEENGSYAISKIISNNIKTTLSNLRKDVRQAIDENRADQCYSIVLYASSQISSDLAALMTAADRTDAATIRLLNDIENILGPLDKSKEKE